MDMLRRVYKNNLIRLFMLALVCSACIHVRVPGNYPFLHPARIQTTVLSLYLFFLILPCLFFCFKTMFGSGIAWLFAIFFMLLSVFPYKYFYRQETDLASIFFEPVPDAVGGINGFFYIFILFLVAAAAFLYRSLRQTKKAVLCNLDGRTFLVLFFLFSLSLLQIIPRLGQNSPKCVLYNAHRAEQPYAVAGVPCEKFYGYHYCGYDALQHTVPSGFFKGVSTDGYGALVINRRGLGPYLYSHIAHYMNPYLAAMAINCFFYFLIIAGGFFLARHITASSIVAVSFSILLSANMYIVFQTVVPYFYLPYCAFVLLIMYLLFKQDFFGAPQTTSDTLLFFSVLACSGLTYDPYPFSSMLFFWGLFVFCGKYRAERAAADKALLKAVIFPAVPILSQYLWENLLKYYGLLGGTDNVNARNDLLDKLLFLPEYIFRNFWDFAALVNKNAYRLLVTNPASKDIEYWPLLGLLGVVSLFAFLPRYVDRRYLKGLYACYTANFSIALVASLAAAIPPQIKYGDAFISALRSNNAYPVLVLAQSAGICLCVDLCFGRQSGRLRNIAIIGLSLIVYACSYVKLLFT